MTSLKKCEKCEKEIYTNTKKCPYCGTINTKRYKVKEKPKSLGVFFFQMLILFVVVDIGTTMFPSIIGDSLLNYKFGREAIIEAIWCISIVIVLVISGTTYLFSQKKEKFGKSIFLGLPMLIIGGISLIGNLVTLETFNFWNFLNLLLYCTAIGLTEEFLCRGWLQNKFIENFGDSRKHVILSIILSSLVFGLMHITNMLAGQGLLETIMQILQATSLGILLGSVYYRSKNIWAVAFLHGFYDFGIFLGELNVIKDCTTGTVTPSIMAFQAFSSFVLMAFYIISAIIIMRRKDTHKLIDKDSELTEQELDKDQKMINRAWIAMAVVFALFYLPIGENIDGLDEYEICYTYEEKVIDGYETHFSHYENYGMHYEKEEYINESHNPSAEQNIETLPNDWNNTLQTMPVEQSPDISEIITKDKLTREYKFDIYYEDYELVIENINTNDKVSIDNENIKDYIVVYDEDSYFIMYYDYKEEKIYYSKIQKDIISDDKKFLEDLKDSFQEYDVPSLAKIGYLTYYDEEDNIYAYAYMISEYGYEFIIDENDNLYMLTK